MELILFGANSAVGTAIAQGLHRKYQGLAHSQFNRHEIDSGLSRLGAARGRNLIVVISIGVLESDHSSGHSGLFRQFNVNAALSSRILEVALSNPLVCEIHIASSVAALAPRPGFLGYYISKRAFDEVARAIAVNPPDNLSIFVWRLPFIPSNLNRGRRPPAFLHSTVEQVSARVASKSNPGIVYVKWSHRLLAKPLLLYGLFRQAVLER